MLRSLGQIQNPIVRSVTAASTTMAMVTMVAALAIGFSEKPRDKSAHQMGVYASLLALVAGAGLGLVVRNPQDTASKLSLAKEPATDDVWRDWRDFQIVRKEAESKEEG